VKTIFEQKADFYNDDIMEKIVKTDRCLVEIIDYLGIPD
jgi:hypothetical protein